MQDFGQSSEVEGLSQVSKMLRQLKDKFQLTTPLVKEEILIYVVRVRTKDHILHTLARAKFSSQIT